MKAGTYYVGDLCYVMHDCWDEVCDLLFAGRDDHGCNEGIFELKDGRRFAMFNTAYGDGTYHSGKYSFMVDSGSLGCILESDIKDSEAYINGGSVIEFPNDFDVSTDGQTISFGDHRIFTGYDDDEYEEEY